MSQNTNFLDSSVSHGSIRISVYSMAAAPYLSISCYLTLYRNFYKSLRHNLQCNICWWWRVWNGDNDFETGCPYQSRLIYVSVHLSLWFFFTLRKKRHHTNALNIAELRQPKEEKNTPEMKKTVQTQNMLHNAIFCYETSHRSFAVSTIVSNNSPYRIACNNINFAVGFCLLQRFIAVTFVWKLNRWKTTHFHIKM